MSETGEAVKHVEVCEIFPKPTPVAVNEANARLIAAAPDLLAVVRRIIANSNDPALRHTHCDGKGTLSGCSMTVADINAARASIAKAEGRG